MKTLCNIGFIIGLKKYNAYLCFQVWEVCQETYGGIVGLILWMNWPAIIPEHLQGSYFEIAFCW